MNVRGSVRWVIAAVLLWGLAAFPVACQKRGAKTAVQNTISPPNAAQLARRERGHQVYLASCAMCHGEWGEGDGPLAPELKKQAGVTPAQLNDPKRLDELGRPEVVRVITLGGAHTHRSNLMPPWGNRLPASVINEIADFVMALPSLKPGIPRATIEKYLQAPPGTPAQGRKLFVVYCTMCHGPNGKGDGFLADTLFARHNVRPRNLTDSVYFARKTDRELYVTVALGGSYTRHSVFMPAWGVTLSPGQIQSLVIYVRSISGASPRH